MQVAKGPRCCVHMRGPRWTVEVVEGERLTAKPADARADELAHSSKVPRP